MRKRCERNEVKKRERTKSTSSERTPLLPVACSQRSFLVVGCCCRSSWWFVVVFLEGWRWATCFGIQSFCFQLYRLSNGSGDATSDACVAIVCEHWFYGWGWLDLWKEAWASVDESNKPLPLIVVMVSIVSSYSKAIIWFFVSFHSSVRRLEVASNSTPCIHRFSLPFCWLSSSVACRYQRLDLQPSSETNHPTTSSFPIPRVLEERTSALEFDDEYKKNAEFQRIRWNWKRPKRLKSSQLGSRRRTRERKVYERTSFKVPGTVT